MIHGKHKCFLCGQNGGLKSGCDHEDCYYPTCDGNEKLVMHVTCARQAGLEVLADQTRLNKKGGPLCYGT